MTQFLVLQDVFSLEFIDEMMFDKTPP